MFIGPGRAKDLKARGIHDVDVGTSGGVRGAERGYCLMIGGPREAVQRLDPILQALAPGRGDTLRPPGRDKLGGTAEEGYLHGGPINRGLRAVLEERQIFRIDHYLGKETVQNLMVIRFANGVLNRRTELVFPPSPLAGEGEKPCPPA